MILPKARKDGVRISCQIRTPIADKLQAYSDSTGVPKTVVIEKALGAWFDQLDKGQIQGMPVGTDKK